MYSTKLEGSKVLIVPGYTDQELLDKANKKTVKAPASFFFDAKNIESQPHRPAYEEFRSSDGLIMPEKNCDEFAQVSMDILVHQNISDTKGQVVIDKVTRDVRLFVTDNEYKNETINDTQLLVGRYVRPEEFTDKYIKVRSDFFRDLKGRTLTLISPLFDPISAAIIEDYHFNIPEGEEEATYSVTFREIANTGF